MFGECWHESRSVSYGYKDNAQSWRKGMTILSGNLFGQRPFLGISHLESAASLHNDVEGA